METIRIATRNSPLALWQAKYVRQLLLDAHEDGEHVWWVDLQLYTGFFASIVAGKFVK